MSWQCLRKTEVRYHIKIPLKHCNEQYVILVELALVNHTSGLPGFITKPTELLLKTNPLAFRGGTLVKIAFQGVKYTLFGGVSLVEFAFQGLNITLLGLLHPAGMKNNSRQPNSVKVA